MPVYCLYMISKSGSLLYQRDLGNQSPVAKQNSNDYLVIAGTLHGVHAISSQITPPGSTSYSSSYSSSSTSIKPNSNRMGLRCVCTDQFNIHVGQTVTGLKTILVTSPDLLEPAVAPLHDQVYRCYCDYVLKNPFYSLDMPIRARLFDDQVLRALEVEVS